MGYNSIMKWGDEAEDSQEHNKEHVDIKIWTEDRERRHTQINTKNLSEENVYI
jgi:hypothetical protein